MGIFNIKLKTKNGNDIGKKVTFTVFLRIKYKKNSLTKRIEAMYTYKIMYGDHKTIDPKKAMKLKINHIPSVEDFTLKVFLNLCHIIGKISEKENLDPDFILFMTPDLEDRKNSSWMYIRDVFMKPGKENPISPWELDDLSSALSNPFDILKTESKGFKEQPTMSEEQFKSIYTEQRCKKLGVDPNEIFMFKSFRDMNPNTMFMLINPEKNTQKYFKSMTICNQLKERFEDNQLQITDTSGST